MSDNKKTVIALGYFDSVHRGHIEVMRKARELAKKSGASLVVFTFDGNLKGAINGELEKCVYTPLERKEIIEKTGVDEVFFAPVTKEFLSLDRKEFLDYLNGKYDISYYVSGQDYKFGFKGLGDSEYLKRYSSARGQQYVVCPTEDYLGEKISTTRIKACLKDGYIVAANVMLGRSYSITGKVFEDRKIGRKLGFPTVNIKIDSDKFKLKGGVYKGRTRIDGVEYKAIINYGARPTYGLNESLIEAHIVDFSGDLYGKELTLFFDDYLRDIKKFSCENELKAQLNEDLKSVKDGKYD